MENTLVDRPAGRPDAIDALLNSLDRYSTQNIKVLEEYVSQQAQDGTSDVVANIALLKLYQFNSQEIKEETVVNILSKGLLRFYTSDFSLTLHLLPPYVTDPNFERTGTAADSLASQVQKLFGLYKLLDTANYSEFWSTYESDDSYADIVADVIGFEDDIRIAMAKTLQLTCRQMSVSVLQEWINLVGIKFNEWVDERGWRIDGDTVIIPQIKAVEEKSSSPVVRFDMLNRVVRRVYENNRLRVD